MYSLTLQNAGGDNVITAGDIIGRINYAVPAESDGAAATYIVGSMNSVAEGAFTSSSNPAALVFSTSAADAAAAVERVRIDKDGKMGIGTSSPLFKLDVNGDFSADEININGQYTFPTGVGNVGDSLVYSGSNQVAWSGVSGGGGITGTGASNYAARWTSSTVLGTGIIYDNGSNVGIGTITPSEKLHVSGGDLLVDSIRPVTISTASNIVTSKKANAGGWEFSHDAIGSSGTNSGGYGWYGTDDVLSRYWIGPAYDTASFNILYSNGNVGINILNPAYDLDLAGTARIEPTSHGMLIGRGSGTSSIRATGATTPSEYLILDSNGQYISLNHYTSDNIVMAYGGGNVGMGGNYSPATKLHIYEDSTYSSENTYAIKISDGGSPETHGMLLGVDSANNIASIQAVDPGTSWARNLSLQAVGGNLGIATVSPTQKLHVAGNIKVDAGGIGAENDGVYMAFPGGGTDSNTASTTLGYLKVQLPVGWTSTMISFDLHVYEYNANSDAATRKFRIGGYNNSGSGGNWTRPIAVYDGDGLVDHNLKVHFGYDGTYSAIYISKMSTAGVDQGASSSWSYPQSFVSNVFGGYTSTTMANWADSWDITFTTVLGTISQTLEVNRSFKLNDSSYVFNDLGNNVDVRIESENLDHLIHTDASKDEVVIYNAVGYGLNYATSEGWTESTESQTGYYGGDFARNGGNGENSCEFGDLPNSMRGLIWKTRNNTTDSGADGGWNKDIEGLDPEKTYISIVYVRRVGSNTNGSFYHGCGSSSGQTETLAGVASTNPYFHSGALTSLPQDVWCVSIGIIHAHSDPVTTSTGIGGVYRLDTGARISFSNHTDFRMGPSTTTQRHRTYLYYDATGDSKLDWCWPGFYDVTSPEIVNFLNTILYDHVSNIDITDFNASSIITESEGISSNDNDTTLPTSAAVKDYVDANSGSSNLIRGSFAVTTSTSVFTVSGGYNTNTLDVYQNGVKLFKGSSYDFTETGGGTTFTLANAATNGDLIEYVALNASTSATGNTSLGSVSVTSNQTVFNTSDTFTSSNLAVFLNGVKLVDGTDYNITSSSQFTLTSTAVSGDVVEYIAYGATVASSNLSKTGDTMTGNLTVNADLIVTGYKETHTDNGNTGTAQTIDISSSTLQTYTLNGNCTFTMPTADAGRSFTMLLKTGAGSFVATFTGVKFPSNTAPTITTTASRMDIITFYSDGTNWYGSIQQEYHV